MTGDKVSRRVYSAEELHRLRSSCSQPKLWEAIEKHDSEDAELVKGTICHSCTPDITGKQTTGDLGIHTHSHDNHLSLALYVRPVFTSHLDSHDEERPVSKL